MTDYSFIRLAAIFGALAVILGAFGAHSLERLISPDALDTFETGIRYHFYHTIMIALVGVLLHSRPIKIWRTAAWLFAVGILLFSGSIYLLSIREIVDLGSWLGPITPIGGTFFIAGWVCLLVGTFKKT
ncbi:MAG TPA: DUF423 domain-containing protein [Saprospiraceae bacterium]|nr:DUF423 domain-containing protein [Saprospiraceae bacterium]